MIKLHVTSGTDPEVNGEKLYYKNALTLGERLADIIINEDEFQKGSMQLLIKNSVLYGRGDSRLPHYLLNGKKNTGDSQLKKNDLIQIGSTNIKVVEFLPEPDIKLSEVFNESLKKIQDEDKDLLDLLIKLESTNSPS